MIEKMTDHEKLICSTLWNDGESITSIAKILPYRIGTAKRLIKDLIESGYLPPRKKGELVKERLRQLVKSGITDSYAIATILGITHQTASTYKSQIGLHTPRPKKNYRPTVLSVKTQQIIADLQNGINQKEIQLKYNVSRQYVSEVKKKYVKE